MSATRLVITADDFGLTRPVDDGIIEAASAGVITAVSVIVNLHAAQYLRESVDRLRSAAPAVAIGLHFNCVVGRPILASTALSTGKGEFTSLPRLAWRVATRRVKAEHIAREAEAQIARLRSIAGDISHIDSHLHAHALPVVWEGVRLASAKNGIAHLRMPIERFRRNAMDPRATLNKALVYASWRFAGAGRARTKEQFAGMSMRGDGNFERRVLELLDTLPPGVTELMVHPGRTDPQVLRYTGYVEGRAVELQTLMSVPVRARLARGDIVLTNFAMEPS